MPDKDLCSITGYEGCTLPKYEEYDECILHCSKENAQKDYHMSMEMLDLFKRKLIEYIALSILKGNTTNDIEHDDIYKYFGVSNSIRKKETGKIKLVEKKLKESTVVFNFIAFPVRDGRDNWDYEPILNKLGSIHFNYCKFYLTNLDLEETKCFFQDCEFFDSWYIQDYALLKNQSNVIYQMCTFHEGTSAAGRKVQEERLSLTNSQFSDCNFGKELVLEYVDVKAPLFNNGDHFKGQASFLKIYHCVFEERFTMNKYCVETVSMQSSVFNSKFEFKNNCSKEIQIDNCNFQDIADYYGSNFENFSAKKSIYEDFVGYEHSSFGKPNKIADQNMIAQFEYVTFKSEINFRNTKFLNGLDIQHANFTKEPQFLNSEIDSTHTTRETFRSIKHSFDSVGNYLDANKYFALEMKKYKEELNINGGRTQEKVLFWFNNFISNFGQDYWKPIKLLLISSVVFFLIYLGDKHSIVKLVSPEISNFLDPICFYFNEFAMSIMPFKKILTKGIEFISLVFYLWYSVLIWQTIVAVKRHTRR